MQLLSKELNCGSCAGLNKEKILEDKCIALGRLPASKGCAKHKPDVFSLFQENEQRLTDLLSFKLLLARMSPNDLQTMASLFLRERKTRRYGFTFLQKVYVRFSGTTGRDYLNNFGVAYVLDANKDTLRLISESAKTSLTVPNEKDSTTVYSVERFRSLRDKIYAEKRWRDPEQKVVVAPQVVADLDKLDSVGLLETNTAARRKIKKAAHKDDLVTLVSKLGKGILDGSKKKKKSRSSGDEEFGVRH